MKYGKLMTVRLNDQTWQQRFNISNLEPYQPPDIPGTIIPDQAQEPSQKSSLNDQADSLNDASRVYRVMVTDIISPLASTLQSF
jgi:hypothetical protein